MVDVLNIIDWKSELLYESSVWFIFDWCINSKVKMSNSKIKPDIIWRYKKSTLFK